MTRDVSIILPTAGAATYLDQALLSLFTAIESGVVKELVVVENGPALGRTQEIVDSIRGTGNRRVQNAIRYVHEPVPGLLAGRHRGVAETSGDIVVLVDDDVVVDESWSVGLTTVFSDPTVGLAGGPCRPLFHAETPPWMALLQKKTKHSGRMVPYLSLIDLGGERIVDVNPHYIWGLNFAVRRDLLVSLGGFHPDIVPKALQHFQGDGETGLTRKFQDGGHRADYSPLLAVRHQIPATRLTLESVALRAYFEGVCAQFSRCRAGDVASVAPEGRLRSTARSARRAIHRRRRRRREPASVPGAHAIRDLMATERARGEAFFLAAYREQLAVRTWTHRPDYWDYAFPTEVETEAEPGHASSRTDSS